jgi:hypothetical protein
MHQVFIRLLKLMLGNSIPIISLIAFWLMHHVLDEAHFVVAPKLYGAANQVTSRH